MYSICLRVCSGLSRSRERTLLEKVMKWRLRDARRSMDEAKRENTRVWREAKRVLSYHRVRDEYLAIWRREKEQYRLHLRELLRSKVSVLVQRYSRNNDVSDSVRDIIVGDQQISDDFSTEPRCYGGVELTEDERATLSLPPKYAVYSKVDTTDCAAQVEKGLAKLRWSIKENEREEREGESDERMSYKPANVFDFRYMRATELPFNQRITLPDRVDDATEIKMYSLKQDLKKITDVMKAKVENGNNLSTQQRRGIASLSNRVRESLLM